MCFFCLQREVDYAVGQVMRTLKMMNLDSDTFVFLTSDNGYATGTSNTFCLSNIRQWVCHRYFKQTKLE